jgi:hypothetical protein
LEHIFYYLVLIFIEVDINYRVYINIIKLQKNLLNRN